MSENCSVAPSKSATQVLIEAGAPERLIADVKKEGNFEAFKVYQAQTKFLLGKVLTVIDAVIIHPASNKSTKDLIKQQFHEQEKWVYHLLCDGTMIAAAGESTPPSIHESLSDDLIYESRLG